jgi:putative flippase GtrA
MKRFLKFGTVGIVNTLITIGSYMLFVYFGMDYILSNVLAYGLGVINSYFWNKNWVFEAKSDNINLFFKFIVVNLITLGFNTFILYLLVDRLDIQPMIAQVFATGFGMIINFLLNKKWTFHT